MLTETIHYYPEIETIPRSINKFNVLTFYSHVDTNQR